MTAPRSPYDPVLVRHARAPSHRGPVAHATSATGVNRPCGDTVHMHVRVDAGACVVGFEGEGCALALAAASALCEVTQGLAPEAVRAIAERLIEALEAAIDPAAPLPGDLTHLLAVRAFPARVGCVRLAPTVLGEALAGLPRAEP